MAFNLRKQAKRILILTNLGTASALLISHFAHLIDPNTLLWPAFFGLSFIPLAFANGMFMLFWLVAKPRYVFIGAIAFVVAWGSFQKHIRVWPSDQEESTGVKVLSFNARLFDLYNLGGNKETRNEIFRYLDAEDPSIICFQEFFNTNDPGYFNTQDTMMQFLSANQVHAYYTAIVHNGKSKFGIATLSAYPILKREKIPLDTAANNAAIFTDIQLGDDTVRVFNIHLASVYISGIQDDLTKHIESNDQDGQIRDLELMTKKLSSGFKRRAHQTGVIKDYIDASPYPVIVCGDLNDTPGSFAYAKISEGLLDAFLSMGTGFGSSYIGLVPALRIDFILLDPRIALKTFSTEQVELSDHRPLKASIEIL